MWLKIKIFIDGLGSGTLWLNMIIDGFSKAKKFLTKKDG